LSDSFRSIAIESTLQIPEGGLYTWNAPSPGAQPLARHDGGGFLSATIKPGGGLTQGAFQRVEGLELESMGIVPIDPVTLFVAAAVVSMDHKLDEIKAVQQEILGFLEEKEKAKHQGEHERAQRDRGVV